MLNSKGNKKEQFKRLPEINSEEKRFRKLENRNISKKSSLLKNNNNSSSSMDDNNEFEDEQKYNSSLNGLDKISNDNSSNFNIKKGSAEEIKEGKNNPLKIYEEIKFNIEKFIIDYINEKSSVFSILKEILNVTILIIQDFVENNKDNNSSSQNRKLNIFVTDGKENNNQKNNSFLNSDSYLDINSKIVFLLKIQKLNNKISKLKEEMEFLRSVVYIPGKKKNSNNFLELFKKKYMEQKSKSKKKELNYLLCIGEQEKKINNLEKQLNRKEKEYLPEDIGKSLKCFPYFHHYDFKEDINPKSIPLFKQFQQEKLNKILEKEKFNSSKIKSPSPNRKKVLINNDSSHSSHNRTKLLLTRPDISVIKKSSKYLSFKTQKDFMQNLDKIKNYNISFEKNKKFKKYISSSSKNERYVFNTDISNSNNKQTKSPNKLKENIKNYRPKTILDNKKEFFLAHPTLSIAGVVKNKELKYIGLPQKLLKLKIHKSIEKNMMITFPSSFNETLVNLEKLRRYKNV